MKRYVVGIALGRFFKEHFHQRTQLHIVANFIAMSEAKKKPEELRDRYIYTRTYWPRILMHVLLPPDR